MNLVAAGAGRSEAISVRPSIALTGGIQLHDFGDHPSTTVSDGRELLLSQRISYDDESISIENSLYVFNLVRTQNFKSINAVVFS